MEHITTPKLLVACLIAGSLTTQASAETLKKFVNMGAVQTGFVEASGTTAGGDFYTIIGGGGDTWDRYDEMGFAYHELAGDFDIRVQVESIQNSGQWSKAGISARESLAEDARRVAQTVSPFGPIEQQTVSGANTMEFLWRTGIQDGAGENGGNNSVNIGAPPYPNAWIRLVRSNTVFTSYRSTDGLNWALGTSIDSATFQGGALPNKLFVGLSVSRHPSATTNVCRAVFTNYTEAALDRFIVQDVNSGGTSNMIFVTYNRPPNANALQQSAYVISGTTSFILGLTAGPGPNTVTLEMDPLIEGDNITVAIDEFADVRDGTGNALDVGGRSRSFVHAAGYELRRIHVQHNKTDDSARTTLYEQTVAYALGFGAWTETRVPTESAALFEDPMPDGDPNPRHFVGRMFGVLSPAADMNALFACSSDDQGRLFLSTDDQPSHKVQIATEPNWNGRREYVTPSNTDGSRGSPPSNISAPQALVGGSKHWLEYIYAEGGGGNNGSVTWDAGTGAPFANGQLPIEEANFVPSRFAYGHVFYNLGPVVVLGGPANFTSIIGGTATFNVAVDGTPPYEFTWKTNGAVVPGATGDTLTFADVQGSLNGTVVSVCVSNSLGGACSTNATLTVLLNPKVLSASSKGNCHALLLDFNRLMNLDGTYTVVCSNNTFGATLLSQDFNANDGGFTVNTPLVYAGPWVYDAASGSWTEAGQGPDNAQQNVSFLNSPTLTLAAGGPVQLVFAHRYSFEQDGGWWDGGQVRISVNGGAFTAVPAAAFSQNGYGGTIAVNQMNALSGQRGFVGNSPTYAAGPVTSVCTLGFFAAGDTIQVQFMASNDANTQGPLQPNWQIDSVQINSLVPNVTPITVTGVSHEHGQNEIKLAVSPDLQPDTNVYYITVLGATSQGDNLVVDPNPTTVTVIHGSDYPRFDVVYEQWDTPPGPITLAAFQSMAAFIADQPNRVQYLNRFETPSAENGVNYGAQLRGLWKVPQDGIYRFWMASDDYGATFLATDANPAHKVQINSEPSWANYRRFTDDTGNGNGSNDGRGGIWPQPVANESGPIALTNGQVVYFQALYTEGGGGDHYSSYYTVVPTLADPDPGPPAGNPPSNLSGDMFLVQRRAPNGTLFATLCDVFLTAPVQNQNGFVGLTATFTAKPDGTPAQLRQGYYYQWSSNGVVLAGATNQSYTTSPLALANSGDAYSVVVSNDFSRTTGSATLTVVPNPVVVTAGTLNDPNNIYITYNVPVLTNGTYTVTNSTDAFPFSDVVVRGYGSSSNTVVLTRANPWPQDSVFGVTIADVTAPDGVSAIVPNPTTVVFSHGVGRFCNDFSAGLPAGTISSGVTPPAVVNGALHLTERVNDQNNAWTIPLPTTQLSSFKAQWKTYLEGVGGADGFSFNVGQNIGTGFTPEEGTPSGLAVCVDTYNNGANDAGVEIKYNGLRRGFIQVGSGADGSGAPAELMKAQWVDTSVEVTSSGLVTFKFDTYVVTGQIPNFTGLTVNQYVFSARTGGANENCWIDDLCIQDYVLGPAAVTVAQTTSTPSECSTVTFTAQVSGSPPDFYQWLRNGVPIAGANNPTYTTPSLRCPADQGVVYSVAVNNLFSSGSGAGTALAVACDNTAPTLAAAGSVNGCSINALFTEAIDPITAVNPANYMVNGQAPGIDISNVVMLAPLAGRAVTLNLSNCLTGNFTLLASNVLDACPARNSAVSTANGTVVLPELLGSDVGTANNPNPPGTNYSFAPGQIDITVGGADFWDNSDHAHFVYTPRTGDFDVKVKVTRLDFQSSWSKAGLDARLNLTDGSPSISTYCDPTNGANQVETRARYTQGGGINDLNGILGTPRPIAMQTPWLRMQRSGDRVLTSVSSNGVDWIRNIDTGTLLCGQMPPTLLVGVMTTPNNGNNGNTTTSELDSFSITPQGAAGAIDAGRLSVVYNAGNLVIDVTNSTCGAVVSARLQGTTELKSPPAQTVWTDIPGTFPVTVPVTSPHRFFRAVSP